MFHRCSALLALPVLVLATHAPLAWCQETAPAGGGDKPVPTKDAVLPDGTKSTSWNGLDLTTKPVRKPMPDIADGEIAGMVAMLQGSFASTPEGQDAALHIHAARVDVEGSDNAVYFELARADTPQAPFRQGVFVFWKRDGAVRLRVLDLPTKNFADAVVGLWTSPSLFPELKVEQLIPNLDLQLKRQGDGWVSEPSGRVPTVRLGAWEIESAVGFSSTSISFNDRGFDRAGKQIFGTADGKPLVFKPFESTIRAVELEGGLVLIDMVPPNPSLPKAQDNTLMAIHYSGWLLDGHSFGTSRGKEAQQLQLPANFIAGFNRGLPGITKGSVRRLWVPSGMAFGPFGNLGFGIPKNAHVIFEVECIFLEQMPPPEVEPVPPVQGGEGAQPAPAPQPAGSAPKE
ncbi:MAG: CpcT/CpeT family chromophore lyase [Phycisphaerales bacterium]